MRQRLRAVVAGTGVGLLGALSLGVSIPWPMHSTARPYCWVASSPTPTCGDAFADPKGGWRHGR